MIGIRTLGLRLILLLIMLPLTSRIEAGGVISAPGTHRAVYARLADGGLYVSIDAGSNWMTLNNPLLNGGAGAGSIAVDAGTGTIYAIAAPGLLTSDDGGHTWRTSLPGPVIFVASAPFTPGIAYAILSYEHQDKALFSTRDAGRTWERKRLPSGIDARSPISVDPGHPATVIMESNLSSDSGQIWHTLHGLYDVRWDPTASGVAYAISDSSTHLHRSVDDGLSWQPMALPSVGDLVAVLPGHPAKLLSMVENRIQLAGATSTTWLRVAVGQPIAKDLPLRADPSGAGLVLASRYDGLLRSDASGMQWTKLVVPFLPIIHYSQAPLVEVAFGPRPIAPDDPISPPPSIAPPATPIAGAYYAGGTDVAGIANDQAVTPCSGPTTEALLVDMHHSTTLYAGTTTGLRISLDACKSWSPPPQPIHGSVSALAQDGMSGILYVAVLPDQLWITGDGGSHWQERRIPVKAKITSLAVPVGFPSTVLVGTTAGLFVTRDRGATWQSRQPMLAKNGGDDINALAVDWSDPGRAWAAAVDDVYQTTDAGSTWQPVGLRATRSSFGITETSMPSHDVVGFTAIAANGSGSVAVGDDQGDLFDSVDHGHTWSMNQSVLESGCKNGCHSVLAVVFDPVNPSHVVAINNADAEADSLDYGASYFDAGVPNSTVLPSISAPGTGYDYYCLAASPRPPLPVDGVPPPLTPGARYVPKTRHSIGAAFVSFYDQHGGIRGLGFPLTEPFTESGQLVQVFERARLIAEAGSVRVSPLGYWLTAGRVYPSVAPGHIAAGQRYFPRTHQALGGRFLSYWQAHQGALLLGAPISPELYEQNGDGSGRTYLVQWFTNGRLEYHRASRDPSFAMIPGLVGKQYLQQRTWI